MLLCASWLCAVVFSFLYVKRPSDAYQYKFPMVLFLGSSLMWSADFIMAFLQEGPAYFVELESSLCSDFLCFLFVFTFAMVLWLCKVVLHQEVVHD